MTQYQTEHHVKHEHILEDHTFLDAMLHMNSEHYAQTSPLENKNFNEQFNKVF